MTAEGVLNALTVCAIVYNLARVAIREAATRQGVDVERISFIDALRWLCELKADSGTNARLAALQAFQNEGFEAPNSLYVEKSWNQQT